MSAPLPGCQRTASTPYPDAKPVIEVLLSKMRVVLGDRFIGMCLSGSITTGDFDGSSDIDVLVVTTRPGSFSSVLQTG